MALLELDFLTELFTDAGCRPGSLNAGYSVPAPPNPYRQGASSLSHRLESPLLRCNFVCFDAAAQPASGEVAAVAGIAATSYLHPCQFPADQALETASTIDQLNSTLAGRYLVEQEIGRGGMATVYLARDLRHDRRVALKLLLAELGAILGPERFLSEIRVTANLQHPNLLPLFDSGEADGRLYYVMPYVEGESLRHRLNREKQIPVDEAVRIAAACASALNYAHEHHVVHRDLKPENILLSAGHPVIADFGIALAVSNAGGARITQSGLSLGTPQYMSPEQAAGDREVDGRSDIYSLACVLYEMLTGDPPHTGSTVQAVIAKVLVEKPGSVRAQRERVPEHVDASYKSAPKDLFDY